MECPFCQSQTSAYSKHCKSCGKTIPPAQYLLEESGVIEPTLAPVPSVPILDSVRKPGRYRFGRLGDRFIAFVLDTAFLFGLFAVVDAWVFMRWGAVDGSELQLTTASLLIAIVLNAATLFLYGWLLEAAWGATLGKAMVGIRVLRTARHNPLAACAVRNALRIVDGLGLYLVGTVVAACSGSRQRIGDMYARTVVIEESFGSAVRITAIVLWIATLAGAAWAVPRICLTDRSVRSPYLNQVVVRVGSSENSAYFRIAGFAVDVQRSPRPH